MISLTTILFGILWVVCFSYFSANRWTKSKKKFPPGPTNWFGIGGFIALLRADMKHPHLGLAKLAKNYGGIMYLDFGFTKAVVVSRYEDMVAIFTKHEFHGRFIEFVLVKERAFNKELGILFSSNEVWRDIRRFSQKRLREAIFGKSELLKTAMQTGNTRLIGTLKLAVTNSDGIVEINGTTFMSHLFKTLYQVFFGCAWIGDDTELVKILLEMEEMAIIASYSSPLVAVPFLRKLGLGLKQYNTMLSLLQKQQRVFREIIDGYRNHSSRDSVKPNFVDDFLNEIRNNSEKQSVFTDDQLLLTIWDMFLAGVETTSHFFEFAFLYMARNPEIQKAIQDEIDGVDPGSDMYSNAEQMPYTQAAILEILRMADVVPLPTPRVAGVDYEYNGMHIPKGACMIFNMHTMFNDPEYWKDPDVFRPTRFLDESRSTLINTERMAIWGFGKRSCVGEHVSRRIVFTYFTEILKQFQIATVPNEEFPSTVPMSGFTLKVHPFRVLVTQRFPHTERPVEN